MHSVVILSAQRTAIGGFLGSLSSFSPADLGTYAAKAAIAKANVEAQAIEHSVFWSYHYNLSGRCLFG